MKEEIWRSSLSEKVFETAVHDYRLVRHLRSRELHPLTAVGVPGYFNETFLYMESELCNGPSG
jgi:hypothetical protein